MDQPPALAGVRVALALAILGFVPGLLDPFVAPKAALVQLSGLALLVGVIVETIARSRPREDSQAGVRASRPRRFSLRSDASLDLAVAGWVAASVLSTVASVSPRLSLIGEIEQRDGLLTALGLAGLYVGTRRSHGEPPRLGRTLDVVLVCEALAAAYALIQVAGLDPLAWGGVSRYPAGAGSVQRPFGTLGNPVLLGSVLAPALGIAAARLASGRGDPLRLAPLVVLLSAAATATLSRGAWLAAFAALGAAVFGALSSGARRSGRRATLAVAAAVVPASLWGAVALRAPLIARIEEGARAEAVSIPARVEIARSVLALWRAHPWLGTGPDTFGLMFPSVQTASFWSRVWLGYPVHADSALLQVVATVGALGALAGLAWLVALARAVRGAPFGTGGDRLDIAAALAGLVVAGAVNPVGIAGAALFAVLSGLMACCREDSRGAETQPSHARGWAWSSTLAVGSMLAIGLGHEWNALLAAGSARSALEWTVGAGDAARASLLETAGQRATEAASRAPWEDELWRLCSDAHIARARDALAHRDTAACAAATATAEAAARKACDLEPRRAVNVQRLGDAVVMRARMARARQGASAQDHLREQVDSLFAEARVRAPVDGLILVDQARGQLELHRADRALEAAQSIVALYPTAAVGYALQAAALMALGRSEEATSALHRALAARWEDDAGAERRAAESLLRTIEGTMSTP